MSLLYLCRCAYFRKILHIKNFSRDKKVEYKRLYLTRPLPPSSILRRKTPNLRACFDQRDGHTWLREMTQENVDFEVRTGPSFNVRRSLNSLW